jgi:hypothetical protein
MYNLVNDDRYFETIFPIEKKVLLRYTYTMARQPINVQRTIIQYYDF